MRARARVSVCDVMRRQRSSRAEYVWQSVGQRDRESLARRGTGTQQTRIAATLSGKIKANKLKEKKLRHSERRHRRRYWLSART